MPILALGRWDRVCLSLELSVRFGPTNPTFHNLLVQHSHEASQASERRHAAVQPMQEHQAAVGVLA